jgi:hypothetical protein
MRYRQDYCKTHDIDWFATYQGIPIHVASNGMIVPDFIDSKNNRLIQQYVSGLTKVFDVAELPVNQNFESIYSKKDDVIREYRSSFNDMACIGFCSFDSIQNEYGYPEYRLNLVAMPHYHFSPDENEHLEYLLELLPIISEEYAQNLGLNTISALLKTSNF